MAERWLPVVMNALMLSLLSQTVMVQKVDLRSMRSEPPWNPADRWTYRSDRKVSMAKHGRKRIDRILNRVMLTKELKTVSHCTSKLPARTSHIPPQGTKPVRRRAISWASAMIAEVP